jgi:O-antigen ligase
MKMEAAIQRQNLFSRPTGIALAILAMVVLWGLNPLNLITLVLLIIVALFLIGVKKPAWAVAALLVSEITLTSFMIATPLGLIISLRLLLIILIGLVLLRSFVKKEINIGPQSRLVLIPALIFLGLSLVSNFVNILIVIYLPAVTKSYKELKVLCGVVFIGLTASAIIAIMQHYNVLGMADNVLNPRYQLAERVPGMAESTLYLSFTLPIATIIVLSIYLAKGANPGIKKLMLPSAVLMVIALYFTYTRSALLGLAVGLLALVLFLKTKLRWEFIFIALLLVVIFIETTGVLEGTTMSGREQSGQESSEYERHVLSQAGVAIALDNPILGIGAGQFRKVSPQYASSIDPELLRQQEEYWEYRTLGSQEAHNDLVMVWASYGTPALAVYLWLFIVISRILYNSHRASKRRFIKGLSIGLAASLVAYIANAFYHNCIAAMPLLWIVAGLSLATAKLSMNNKTNQQSKQTLAERQFNSNGS